MTLQEVQNRMNNCALLLNENERELFNEQMSVLLAYFQVNEICQITTFDFAPEYLKLERTANLDKYCR